MVVLTIDRFEDNIAVCEKEDCTIVNLLRDKLPKGVHAGNVLMLLTMAKLKLMLMRRYDEKK